MPLHDYQCPVCGTVLKDVYRSVEEGAIAHPPACPNPRHRPRIVVMEWIPQARFDLKTDGEGGRGFQKFTIHRQVPTRDGMVQVEETIDSMNKLRQIEKDSEQRYRDGEGEPLRFRAYAQNASNMGESSFGRSGEIGERHYDSGPAAPLKKPEKVDVRRHGQKKPKIALARHAGQSPLDR